MGFTLRSIRRAIVAIVFAAMFAVPAVATAATFSAKAPASGAVLASARPVVSVVVYDASGVKGLSACSMTLDGKSVTPTLSYKKRGSYTRLTLTYRPRADLKPGTHAVSARVKNRRGRSYSASWSFVVGVRPVPVTTASVQESYEGTAAIDLTAVTAPVVGPAPVIDGTDGIAHTYYILDGAAPVEGTLVTALPPMDDFQLHSLVFWSESTGGVVEPRQTVWFSVGAPADTRAPDTSVYGMGYSVGYHSYIGTVTVSLTSEDYVPGSGVAATFYQLDGGRMLPGTKVIVTPPARGQVHHVLRYWATDNAGNVEPVREFVFDVAAEPVYEVVTTTSNARSSYAGTATILLTPHDGGRGVAGTYYRLDDAAAAEGTRVVVPAPEEGSGNHTLEFWSVDGAGNVEDPHHVVTFLVEADQVVNWEHPRASGSCVIPDCHSANVCSIHARPPAWGCATCHAYGIELTVDCLSAACHPNGMPVSDTVAPVTDCDADPLYTVPASIVLRAVDGLDGSGVAHTWWRLDGGAWQEGALPVVSAQGMHALEYYSVDVAGNAESHKSVTFRVDTVAPTTSSNALGVYAGPATIVLTAGDSEGGSGVAHTWWRLDGGAWQEGALPVVSAQGIHSLEYYSVDVAGNAENHKSLVFRIDTTAPTTSVRTPEQSYIGTATIILDPVDSNGSGVAATYYRLDGGTLRTGTVVVVSPPASGTVPHTLTYYSVDLAGNAEGPKTFNFTVSAPPAPDTTPPVTTLSTIGAIGGKARFVLVPTDSAGLGVDYTQFKVDGGVTQTGTTVEIDLPASGSVPHSIEYWSVDKAGNVETHRVFNVVLTPTWGGSPV